MASVSLQGILLVYDITNEKSFENIKTWIKNIEQHASADVRGTLLVALICPPLIYPISARIWVLATTSSTITTASKIWIVRRAP